MLLKSFFTCIGLIGKPGSMDLQETLDRLIKILSPFQVQIHIADDCAEQIQTSHPFLSVPRHDIGLKTDLVIVIGGDGSLLHAARSVVKQQVPLLGINRGRLGFLTDITPNELEISIPAVLNGHYSEEARAMLEVQVMRQNQIISRGMALNDVVLYSGDIAQMIEFEVFINDQFVYRQRSDGLITSTPTGSTAYALSGGGPILHPGVPALALVPMHPHTLSSRPIVVQDNSRIRLRITNNNTHYPKISCDGQIKLDTQPSDEIHITKLPQTLRLIHPEAHDYFAMLRNKLGWGQR